MNSAQRSEIYSKGILLIILVYILFLVGFVPYSLYVVSARMGILAGLATGLFTLLAPVRLFLLAFTGQLPWLWNCGFSTVQVVGFMWSLSSNNILIYLLFLSLSLPFVMSKVSRATQVLFVLTLYPEVRIRFREAYFSQYVEGQFFSFLPEESVSELYVLKKRWQRQRLNKVEIRRKTLVWGSSMVFGLLRCAIENVWLNEDRT